MDGAPSNACGLMAEFLVHLARARIISDAQLRQAQEALTAWPPFTASREASNAPDAQQHQTLPAAATPTAPRAIKRPLAWLFDAPSGSLEQQGERSGAKRRFQFAPPVARDLELLEALCQSFCSPNSAIAQGCRLPLEPAPAEDDTREWLSALPPNVLDQLMSLLAASEEEGIPNVVPEWRSPRGCASSASGCGNRRRCAVRVTCSWLRRAFDRCNTRLVLRGDDQQLQHGFPACMQQLLSSCPRLSSLTLAPSLTSMTWSEVLGAGGPQLRQHLEQLVLRGRHDVEDLGPLSACSRLQDLDLQDCKNVRDLRPLAPCAALRHLNLSFCEKVQELAPLAGCGALQRLELEMCRRVGDLAPLVACSELRHLDITRCSLPDLGPLSACTRLQHLNAAANRLLVDLNPLAACTALQHLRLSSCRLVKNLRPLASCRELQDLRLSFCQELEDLGPLAGLAKLQVLHLPECPAIQDLGSLGSCTGLRSLNLMQCTNVRSVAPLAACTGLQLLDLRGRMHLGSLQPLTALRQLRLRR